MPWLIAFAPVLMSSMMLYMARSNPNPSSPRLWLGAMAMLHLYIAAGGALRLFGWNFDGLPAPIAVAAILYSVAVATAALLLVANRPVAGRMRALLAGYAVGLVPVGCTVFLLAGNG